MTTTSARRTAESRLGQNRRNQRDVPAGPPPPLGLPAGSPTWTLRPRRAVTSTASRELAESGQLPCAAVFGLVAADSPLRRARDLAPPAADAALGWRRDLAPAPAAPFVRGTSAMLWQPRSARRRRDRGPRGGAGASASTPRHSDLLGYLFGSDSALASTTPRIAGPGRGRLGRRTPRRPRVLAPCSRDQPPWRDLRVFSPTTRTTSLPFVPFYQLLRGRPERLPPCSQRGRIGAACRRREVDDAVRQRSANPPTPRERETATPLGVAAGST